MQNPKMIKFTGYLLLRPTGSMKLYMNPPSANSKERIMALDLMLPEALFKKPVLQAKITMEGGAPSTKLEVTAGQIEDVLMDAGFNLEVAIKPQ